MKIITISAPVLFKKPSQINLKKNANNHFLLLKKCKKYRRCPALLTTLCTYLDIVLLPGPEVLDDVAVRALPEDRDLAVGPGRAGLSEVDKVALHVLLDGLRDGPLYAEGGLAEGEDVADERDHRGALLSLPLLDLYATH